MNERIRELSYEAQKYALNKITGPDLAGINELWQEKFAELIVQECSYLADQAHHKVTGGKTAGGYIRQQFGVDE